jgi:hypothetical protein
MAKKSDGRNSSLAWIVIAVSLIVCLCALLVPGDSLVINPIYGGF